MPNTETKKPMHPRGRLHLPKSPIERILHIQQWFFGCLVFGPLFLAVTIWWAGNAVHLGWDHSGLPILTFLLSELAIYMSWVVTNILNRTSARDAARDNLEADEVTTILEINQHQLDILNLLREHIALHNQEKPMAQAIIDRLKEIEALVRQSSPAP